MAAKKVSKTGAGAGGTTPAPAVAGDPVPTTQQAAAAAPTSTTAAAVIDGAAPRSGRGAPASRGSKANVNSDATNNKSKPGSGGAVTVLADAPPGAEHLQDAEWLEQQRQLLIKERAEYTRSAESLAAEAASLMADREPGDVQFDEESGEGDTLAVERDRDLALSAAARQSVEQIDEALARIAEGTYGVCEVGGDIIPQERLEALPEASVCVAHKVQSFG